MSRASSGAERSELCGGREQQRRSVAAVSQRKRAPRTHNINLSALQPIERPVLGNRDQRERRIGGSPTSCFACAAANARWARRRGSGVSATDRS